MGCLLCNPCGKGCTRSSVNGKNMLVVFLVAIVRCLKNGKKTCYELIYSHDRYSPIDHAQTIFFSPHNADNNEMYGLSGHRVLFIPTCAKMTGPEVTPSHCRCPFYTSRASIFSQTRCIANRSLHHTYTSTQQCGPFPYAEMSP